MEFDLKSRLQKTMKSMTIVVKFKNGESPTPVTFGDKVLGGEVTGLAYN